MLFRLKISAGFRSSNRAKRVNGNLFGLNKSMLPAAFIFIFSFHVKAQDLNVYFTQTEIKKANTAVKESYLNATEKEVYKILNLARSCPDKFLKFFYAYAKEHGLTQLASGKYYPSLTKTLKEMKPVKVLHPDRKMYELAQCWAMEAGHRGITGHDRKKCKDGYFAECCTYGRTTAVEIVMSFLIDEGVSSLGHRKICLSSEYEVVGIAQQDHSTYGTNTVLDFTYKNEYAAR